MSKKVAVYVRTSTVDQSKGRQSQEWAMRRYLQSHELEAKWYKDCMSGSELDRPNFAKLQRAIFSGEHDCVVCWKLDRLSRSLKDGINILTDWLAKDIRIVAISQQLDFSGSVGQLVASVLFAVAQMERENLRENTKRGLAAARAKGVKLGGRTPGKWTAEVRPLHDQGISVSEIAKHLESNQTGRAQRADGQDGHVSVVLVS